MHPGRISRGRRVRRALATAGFATFVATFAHRLGGGDAPGPLTIVLALLVTLPLAIGLAGRRADWRTALSAGIAQLALHGLSSLGLDRPGGAVARADAPRGPHAHHGALLVLDPGPAAAAGGHGLMLIGHLFAGLLTIVALVHGDRMLDAAGRILASTVRALVPLPVAPVPLPEVRAGIVRDPGFRPTADAVRRSASPRRGPPASASALG